MYTIQYHTVILKSEVNLSDLHKNVHYLHISLKIPYLEEYV